MTRRGVSRWYPALSPYGPGSRGALKDINSSILLRLERGSDQAAPLARVDGLEPLMLAFPASGRQALFLGTTGPRATRPEETRRGATPVGQGRLAVSTKW